MKHVIRMAVAVCVISLTAAAQESTRVTGYLVDKMCASGMVKKSPADAMDRAAKHTRECAMEKDCAAAGYGVVSDGKWIQFDSKGNEKAADFLKHTKQTDHLLVDVNGSVSNGVIAVSSISKAKTAPHKAPKKTGA
ncbi:MAG TPA: hypothetical protein VK470_14030 [Bacteroidota bacterium]|nr:hypothetical protein [Bacteroidota bacterium]